MLTLATERYSLSCAEAPPELRDAYVEKAKLVEQLDLKEHRAGYCWVAVCPAAEPWPTLVVEQRYSPAGYGFFPGLLLLPETEILLVGAGTRLLAYDLRGPARLWEGHAESGFWRWNRHGDHILMSAELELAAWDLHAQKLWTAYVEPPWDYRIEDGNVHLDVMGEKSVFPLVTGRR